MASDSFWDFLKQEAVIQFLIFMGIVFSLAIVWAVVTWRNAHRRRMARAQGLPIPPGTITEIRRYLVGLFKNMFSSGNTPSDDSDGATNNTSLSASDFDFPELDFEPIVEDVVQPPPPPVAPKPMAKPKPAPPPEPEVLDDIPVSSMPNRQGIEYVPGSGKLPEDAVEVMRVWRDLNDGSLIVQVGDSVFQSIAEMRSRGLAKRFISVVKELAQMATVGARAAGLQTPRFDATSDVVSQPGAWSATLEESIPEPLPAPPQPSRRPLVTMTPTPPEIPPSTSSLGIAGQIDYLLQRRLEQTPVFRGRKIRMSSNPDGTLLIEVDGGFYGAIGEVPDLEVQEFILQVVNEWESKQ